jgi:hypothetical protein
MIAGQNTPDIEARLDEPAGVAWSRQAGKTTLA